jgi:hypothetical protein
MTHIDYYDASPPEEPHEVQREMERICAECEMEDHDASRYPACPGTAFCAWHRDRMVEWAEEQARADDAAEERAAESREDQ